MSLLRTRSGRSILMRYGVMAAFLASFLGMLFLVHLYVQDRDRELAQTAASTVSQALANADPNSSTEIREAVEEWMPERAENVLVETPALTWSSESGVHRTGDVIPDSSGTSGIAAASTIRYYGQDGGKARGEVTVAVKPHVASWTIIWVGSVLFAFAAVLVFMLHMHVTSEQGWLDTLKKLSAAASGKNGHGRMAGPGNNVRSRSSLDRVIGHLEEKIGHLQRQREEAVVSQRFLEMQAHWHAQMTHDVRSAVGNMSLSAQLALTKIRDGDMASAAEAIDRVIRHGEKISEDLKTEFVVSRQNQPEVSLHNVARMIEDQVMMTRDGRSGNTKRFSIWISPDIPQYVLTNEAIVASMLRNTIENAEKMTPKGGEIEILFHREDAAREYVIDIRDSGPGVPEAQQESLFEEGDYKVNGTIRKIGPSEGMGRGLAMVADHMGKIHGELRLVCDSHPLGGAWFQAVWPAMESHSVEHGTRKTLDQCCNVQVDLADPDEARAVAAHINRSSNCVGFVQRGVAAGADILVVEGYRRRTAEAIPTIVLEAPSDPVTAHLEGWVTISEVEILASEVIGGEDTIGECDMGGSAETYRGGSLLLVDDSEANLEALSQLLISRFPELNGAIIEASSAEEAMQKIRVAKGVIESAIIDYQLPGQDGVDLSERIRSMSDSIKIALVSGNPSLVPMERVERIGVESVMGRPLDMETLERFLMETLAVGRGNSQEAPVEVEISQEMRDACMEKANSWAREARTRASQKDWKGVASVMHKAAGTCQMLGVDEVGAAFYRVERSALDGEEKEILASLEEAEREVRRQYH
ncbi:integral membrane sensor hybrid histidine kinase (plasmid) [Thioalkalivibrio sp. K90mix]|uniref:ATP-binding response regulator n=1 Tax=Thioalkalivibrio sp. (strain K90mix) TaxID=396595 RepID=UPI000195A726|nr:hybrid sensor histidine kinase/response regulator [Thioalkalivibrio sp. K90mix]ADC73293.1 integral membrane sensor hybrid histidine kinase [Thioalkalivibrio sp. K90mix]